MASTLKPKISGFPRFPAGAVERGEKVTRYFFIFAPVWFRSTGLLNNFSLLIGSPPAKLIDAPQCYAI
jgi:hypothetical protein